MQRSVTVVSCGTRKYTRNRDSAKSKRYRAKYMTMQGMMGRKVRALAKSSIRDGEMNLGEAMTHWRKNRKRGLRNG